MLFESVYWGNESYALTDGPAQTDWDNGWGIYYNPNTDPVTFTFEVFDNTGCGGECNVGFWAARADAFKTGP